MMKVKVVVKFKDKYTSSWHNVDEILTVSEERYKEIERFVKVIIDEKPKGSSKKNNNCREQDTEDIYQRGEDYESEL